jgi:hypothetical protein
MCELQYHTTPAGSLGLVKNPKFLFMRIHHLLN